MFTSSPQDYCSATQLASATQDWQPPPPLTGDSDFETPSLIGKLHLTINTVQWKGKEQILELWSDRSSWRIGRDAGNDIQVLDPKVSTVHVRIDHDPSNENTTEQITITDVSRNGTYLGTRRLQPNKTEVLKPGESFSLVTSPYIRGHPEPLLLATWKPSGFEEAPKEYINSEPIIGLTQAMPPGPTQVQQEVVVAPQRRKERETVGQQDPVIAQLSGDVKFQWRPSTAKMSEDGLRSSVVIGRNPASEIVVNDDRISGSHVTLEHDGTSFHIIDSSTNGTYLNEERLPKRHVHPLKSGDHVSLASLGKDVLQAAGVEPGIEFTFRAVLTEYKYGAAHGSADVVRPLGKKAPSITAANTMDSDPPRDTFGRALEDLYYINARLGQGNFATVHSATEKKEGGKQVAIKELDLAKLLKFQQNTKSNSVTFRSEFEVLRELNHPAIVKFYTYFENSRSLFIVTELMKGGDLLDRLLNNGAYREADARVLFRDLCSGVAYMHSHNIIHRDLKPENILLTADQRHGKISDLGLARHTNPLTGEAAGTYCGTPHYFAPEMVMLKLGQRGTYDNKVDCWALGVILYVILSATPPFAADDDPDGNGGVLDQKILNAEYTFAYAEWEDVTETAKDLIDMFLQVDDRKRWSAQRALDEHQWLLSDDKLEESAAAAVASSISPPAAKRRRTMTERDEEDDELAETEESPSKLSASSNCNRSIRTTSTHE